MEEKTVMTPTDQRLTIASQMCAALVTATNGVFVVAVIVQSAYALADELLKEAGDSNEEK